MWASDSYSFWAECWDQKTPERKLLVAILERAILDYLMEPGQIKEGYHRERAQREQQAGFEYLFSPEVRPWSARWICDQLVSDGYALWLNILGGVVDLKADCLGRHSNHKIRFTSIFIEPAEPRPDRRRKK